MGRSLSSIFGHNKFFNQTKSRRKKRNRAAGNMAHLSLTIPDDDRLCSLPFMQETRRLSQLQAGSTAPIIGKEAMRRIFSASKHEISDPLHPTTDDWDDLCGALIDPIGQQIHSDAKRASTAYKNFCQLSISGSARPLSRYLSLYLPDVRKSDIGELHGYWPRENVYDKPSPAVRQQASAFLTDYPDIDEDLLQNMVVPMFDRFTVQ